MLDILLRKVDMFLSGLELKSARYMLKYVVIYVSDRCAGF